MSRRRSKDCTDGNLVKRIFHCFSTSNLFIWVLDVIQDLNKKKKKQIKKKDLDTKAV